jgi:hypothetical protein
MLSRARSLLQRTRVEFSSLSSRLSRDDDRADGLRGRHNWRVVAMIGPLGAYSKFPHNAS